jgi:hypothetical protein
MPQSHGRRSSRIGWAVRNAGGEASSGASRMRVHVLRASLLTVSRSPPTHRHPLHHYRFTGDTSVPRNRSLISPSSEAQLFKHPLPKYESKSIIGPVLTSLKPPCRCRPPHKSGRTALNSDYRHTVLFSARFNKLQTSNWGETAELPNGHRTRLDRDFAKAKVRQATSTSTEPPQPRERRELAQCRLFAN